MVSVDVLRCALLLWHGFMHLFFRYTSILRDRATLGTIVTCRIRKSFISSNLWSFKVQEFVDRGGNCEEKKCCIFRATLQLFSTELIALCRVLGVEGVRFLDDRLVRMVSALFKEIKVCGLHVDICAHFGQLSLPFAGKHASQYRCAYEDAA